MDEQSGESKEEEVIGAGKGESGIENKVVLVPGSDWLRKLRLAIKQNSNC